MNTFQNLQQVKKLIELEEEKRLKKLEDDEKNRLKIEKERLDAIDKLQREQQEAIDKLQQEYNKKLQSTKKNDVKSNEDTIINLKRQYNDKLNIVKAKALKGLLNLKNKKNTTAIKQANDLLLSLKENKRKKIIASANEKCNLDKEKELFKKKFKSVNDKYKKQFDNINSKVKKSSELIDKLDTQFNDDFIKLKDKLRTDFFKGTEKIKRKMDDYNSIKDIDFDKFKKNIDTNLNKDISDIVANFEKVKLKCNDIYKKELIKDKKEMDKKYVSLGKERKKRIKTMKAYTTNRFLQNVLTRPLTQPIQNPSQNILQLEKSLKTKSMQPSRY
jgi:hypothetical protein